MNMIEVFDDPQGRYTAKFHIEHMPSGAEMTMFHLDVFFFSPEVLRDMLRNWAVFREHVTCPLFCMGDVDDDKFEKFIGYFGFEYLNEVACTDGQTRRLFINYEQRPPKKPH